MKSKTSPGMVSIIDSDTMSSDGLQESLIPFQLLEMGAPNSSMVKSYGRLKIFESYKGVLQGVFDPNKTRRTRPGEVNIKPNE